MRSISRMMAVAAALSLGLVACAGDVTTIDRTQPNKVEKSIFEPNGEWYFRATVVETDFNQGFLFEGLEGEMDRIRWDIRQDQLIAYRSYEWLIGAETGTGEVQFQGNPIAAFKVLSHFDVIRDYNTATGEQSNVLVENTTDRPWFERQWMRVDWSQNLLTNTYSLESFVSAVSASPYYVQEHEVDNMYRPEVTATNINVVGNYLITTDFYTCYYTFLDPYWCGASEAKLKLSFMKVTERDYEVMEHPDVANLRDPDGNKIYKYCYRDGTCEPATVPIFERFGFFRHERRIYDEEFLWTREGRVFVGHRWNIWKTSHDMQGNLIPIASRQPGTFTFHTNVDFPTDNEVWMVTAATQADVDAGTVDKVGIVADWDQSFRNTVASLKAQVNPGITADQLDPIFLLERNSCNIENATSFASSNDLTDTLKAYGINSIARGNLKRACSLLEWASDGEFQWQKQGDLRHSFLHWVDTPQQAGPLGYGPSAADPVTGEIISATANMYGAAIDTYAAYAADVVGLMNGTQTIEEITQGDVIRDHIENTRMRTNRDLSRSKMASFNDRMRGGGGSFLPSRMSMKFNPISQQFEIDEESRQALVETVASTVQRGSDKLGRLAGSNIERELLLNDDLKRAILGPDAFQPGQALTGDNADFSISEWMMNDLKANYHRTMMKVASHSIMMAEWADPGIVSLATELQGKTWEEVYSWMRSEIYRSVMAHEIGHTVGLRHNFQGSFDALNYKPEFWTGIGIDGQPLYRQDTNGKWYVDKDQGGDKHMYSTIMDYDARFFADSLQGIGLYDNAAIKFGYGGLVEVFDQGVAPWGMGSFLWLNDYTDIPKLFGDEVCRVECDTQGCFLNGCTGQVADDFLDFNGYYNDYIDAANAAWAAKQDGDMATYHQLDDEADIAYETYNRIMNDWLLAAMDDVTPNTAKIHQRVDVPLQSIIDEWTHYWMDEDYDLPDEVPYKFCPDEYAGYTWVECQPYDKGANFLEVTRDRMERYDSYYFFSNFKRDRAAFNDSFYINSYISRMYSRYFAQMSNVYIYYLYGFMGMGDSTDGTRLTLIDFPVGRDWQAAGMEGLNFLASVVEQPEPGTYCLDSSNTLEPVYRPTRDGTKTANCLTDVNGDFTETMEVPLGVGKYFYTNWTDEYYYKATRIGTFYDKYAALFAMTDNEGFFYRDFASYFDVGAFALSYWSGRLENEMLDLFSGAFTGGTGTYAWRYDGSASVAGTASEFQPSPVVDIYTAPINTALPKIEAASSYTLRYWGVVLPMIRFNAMFDYTADFSNYARICLEGFSDCMDFFDPTDPSAAGWQEEYVDPLTNYRYIASLSNRPSHAIGATLLKEAQKYADDVYTPALSDFETAEIAHSACVLGSGDCSAEVLTVEQSRHDLLEAERGVNRLTSFIDTVREIGYLMD